MSKTFIEEAKGRCGNTAAWREFEKRSELSKETGDELMKLFAQLGALKDHTLESDEAKTAVADVKQYIIAHYYECNDEIFAGLGEMNIADERFKKTSTTPEAPARLNSLEPRYASDMEII